MQTIELSDVETDRLINYTLQARSRLYWDNAGKTANVHLPDSIAQELALIEAMLPKLGFVPDPEYFSKVPVKPTDNRV